MSSGSQSPFFGKDAMKTFERYFLKNKELHKEKKLRNRTHGTYF